jgi:DNA topoisomerase-6 subunit B
MSQAVMLPEVAAGLNGGNHSRTMGKKTTTRATAETMAAKQRDISVSEFFAKNRHLLGFDNPRKALLTTVKEAVDNSLDACEEGGILPDITVVIEDLEEAGAKRRSDGATKGGEQEGNGAASAKKPKVAQSSRYRVTVVDNGPGIVKKQVEHIFGRLLYGSKFHRLKMSRGQQGIGISAAGMYGLITTGKPMVIQTRPSAQKPAHHIELAMNTKTNRAEVTVDEETDDFPLARLRELTAGTRELSAKGELLGPREYPTGTSVSIELEGRYQKGRGSVDEFLELTAIANPHARIVFVPPGKVSEEEGDEPLLREGAKGQKGRGGKGEAEGVVAAGDAALAVQPGPAAAPAVTTETNGVLVFPRAVAELPPETKEIQPHPRGVELGTLLQMLKEAESERETYTLYKFLQEKFSRVSDSTAKGLCERIGANKGTLVTDIEHAQAEKLYRELQEAKLPPPPTDCLAPIGVQQLLKGMFKGVRAEFYAASSREPNVYRGRPFLIEAAIAFGGELPGDETARVIRFANRVPLLFQQSACSSFKAVIETNWRNYDLQQPRGAVPVGALVIMIHMASVWVPFTSESKEAIADYDEIRKEMKLALQECGRKLGTYLNKRAKMRREGERRDVFERYIGEIAKAVEAINGTDAKKLYEVLLSQAKRKTAIADVQLDEEGKRMKEGDPADQDGVLVVAAEGGGEGAKGLIGKGAKGGETAADAFVLTKTEATRLKVAGMPSGDEEEQPRLIDVEPVKRSGRRSVNAKGARSSKGAPVEKKDDLKPKGAKAGGAKGEERTNVSAPAPLSRARTDRTPSVPAPAPGPEKKAKPRLRLVNGKMVPVEEGPGLF